jgi:HipA-like protein
LYPVKISPLQTEQERRPSERKREDHLSKDKKWRSFPKVPHLLQYVISGNYFGKVKIHGGVGSLTQNNEGDISFAYDEDYLNSPAARPLSQSLPLARKRFKRRECRPFFAGVLPEESKREIIARNLGISVRSFI